MASSGVSSLFMPPCGNCQPSRCKRRAQNTWPLACNSTIPTLGRKPSGRSEEHTSELQSLMRISYAVFCLKKKTQHKYNHQQQTHMSTYIKFQNKNTTT